MSNFQIQKAERTKLLLRGAMIAPSGGGKTMSALRLAKGFAGPNGKIGLIDTEAKRSLIYASQFGFDIIHLDPPFRPERYIEAIEAFEAAGYDILIIDSASHEWFGEGGILSDLDKMPGSNSYTKWSELTPRHTRFVEKLTRTSLNLIITLRGKDEYVLEEDNKGKKVPKKVGVGAIQRDGLEYEMQFTLLIDQQNHVATASKDNTGLFEQRYEVVTEAHGKALREWCEVGVAPPEEKVEDALAEIEKAQTREELIAVLQKYPSRRDVLKVPAANRQTDLIISQIVGEETASTASMMMHKLSDQIDRLGGEWRDRINRAAKKHVDALSKAEREAREQAKAKEGAAA